MLIYGTVSGAKHSVCLDTRVTHNAEDTRNGAALFTILHGDAKVIYYEDQKSKILQYRRRHPRGTRSPSSERRRYIIEVRGLGKVVRGRLYQRRRVVCRLWHVAVDQTKFGKCSLVHLTWVDSLTAMTGRGLASFERFRTLLSNAFLCSRQVISWISMQMRKFLFISVDAIFTVHA